MPRGPGRSQLSWTEVPQDRVFPQAVQAPSESSTVAQATANQSTPGRFPRLSTTLVTQADR